MPLPQESGQPKKSTKLLREAASAIHNATTAAGVTRVLLAAATQLCRARSAVWWQRDDGTALIAAAVRGVKLSPEAASFSLGPRFWCDEDKGAAFLYLSPARPDHASFLAALESARGIIIRPRHGRRWIGALSVHDGEFGDDSTDLLVTLAHQAVLALETLELAEERRQLAEGQRRSISEMGIALSSALGLDELLQVICHSTASVLHSEACLLYLAEEDGPLLLRARHIPDRPRLRVPEHALSELAESVRARPIDHPLWHTGRRLPVPAGRSLSEIGVRSLFGLPLAIRGEPLGALLALSSRPRAFSAAQRNLMVSFAAQAAVAIENLGLVENMQHRLLELADLTWVSSRIVSTLDTARIAATVTHAACKALNVPRATLFLVAPDGRYMPLPQGDRDPHHDRTDFLPPDGHLGAEALRSGTPQMVADADLEHRCEDPMVKCLSARSVLCVPMTAQQGMRGVFVVADDQPRRFRSHTVALLSTYAGQAALALQSAILYQDVVRHLDQLAKLFEVSQSLASSLELSDTLDAVLKSASELLNVPVCSVMLLDPESKQLVIKATRGMRPGHDIYAPVRPGEGMAGRAFQSGTVLMSGDITRDGRFKYREGAREAGLRTAVAAPLIARGRTVGVLNLYRSSSLEFTEQDLHLLTPLANSAAVAIENANLYQDAQERSQFLAAMMSELNHRMRNTLQSIAGLLRMELERPRPRSVEEAVRRGISRIQAVAVVQELVPTRDVQFVDIKQAAQRILDLTCQAARNQRIHTQVSGARVMLPSQRATSAALIFSELVDNAIRHGLAGSADGQVTIGLAEAGPDVVIQVRDNGIGLPEGFDLDSMSGLGLKIVRGLVEEELGGKLEFEASGGVTVRAIFPKR